jgi:hypothetical protein
MRLVWCNGMSFGNSEADLKDAVVVVSGDEIFAVGRKVKIRRASRLTSRPHVNYFVPV